MIERQGEAIVLRTWPFLEADLLVSLFTRDQGRIKGVARHALRSRRRFGGALEPMTVVRATWAERTRPTALDSADPLVRLHAFEILASPLSQPIDYPRTAALQLLAEVLERALPDQAPDDAIYRLTLATLEALATAEALTTSPAPSQSSIWLPITYFCLWISRLQGWMPQLTACILCRAPLEGRTAFYNPSSDGITCDDCTRSTGTALSPNAIATAQRIFRVPLRELTAEGPPQHLTDLRRFAIELLERHIEHRLATARALNRL